MPIRRTNKNNQKKWLKENKLSFEFIDLKSVKIEEISINLWLEKINANTLINKNSRTWKLLSSEIRENLIDNLSARRIINKYPLVMKRPIITHGEHIVVGFSKEKYEKTFRE